MSRRILLGLLAVLLLIQVFRPAKNSRPGPQPHNVTALYPAPAGVQAVLERACYDCHSNNTRYPWYTEVQPVAGWYGRQVTEGLEHGNFDEFRNLPPRRQIGFLERCIDQVTRREMPPSGYTALRREATLSVDEVQALAAWARDVQRQIRAAALPADSAGAAADRR
ncbi:heme-binding domain-containing protein [Flaviaesturariibacter amylovorans]|uniref:Haem-binding domain-containing protein n=1 Tax=Flaviaesturariibacter amylovorans TaxID=1084520 RepID=A0ABP8GDR2_9BACT